MELLDSKTTYEGSVANVVVKRYRRLGGTEVERQVIEHPGSVAILAHRATSPLGERDLSQVGKSERETPGRRPGPRSD